MKNGNNSMSSKSIEWVDNAKFLGIFLVVLGHVISKGNGCYNNGVLLVIYRFIYLFICLCFLLSLASCIRNMEG